MDPATLATIVGFVNAGLTAFHASENVLRYWRIVAAGLPLAVELTTDGYRLLVERIRPIMDMAQSGRDPTPEEWTALDDHVADLLAQLHAEALRES